MKPKFAFRTSACLALLLLGSNVFAQDEQPPGPPDIIQIVPAPDETVTELLSVEVTFDRKVTGVDASDLLINGQPALDVSETILGQFQFVFDQPPDGPVQVAWAASHGIVDELGNPFGGGSWAYTMNTKAIPKPFISEFMASNKKSFRDSDGDSSDWIELYNPSDNEVSLDGWFLSVAADNLAQWKFPAIGIAGKGYLVVFASAKDRTDPSAELHTNFKLNEKGGFLALVSPQMDIVSAFAPSYPAQTVDVSYGRVIDSPQTVGFYTKPTPGQPNSTSGAGFAPPVDFSRASSGFTEPFLLTLSTIAKDAVIHFTTNGVLPGETSPIYSAPLQVASSMQIRARAFQPTLFPGPPRTETYAYFSNLVNFTSTLPIIVIQTIGRAPVASIYTTSQFSLYEPIRGVTSFTNPPTLMVRGGVHLRGSSTLGEAKGSYRWTVWDEFNEDKTVSLLGLPSESDWVLYAPNEFEPVMIHNPFIHGLSRDIGMYSSRTRFVEVFLQSKLGTISSNNYNGIYVLEEKIKIGPNRVNIDKLRPQNVKPPAVTGGYLMKIDRTGPGDATISAGGATVIVFDPKAQDLNLAVRKPQKDYISTYFSNFSKALNSTNWRDPKLGYAAYIDVPSWIDFHVVEALSGSVDTLVLSTYFHKPRDGKITFGPHWDFDRALGSTDGRDANPKNWQTGPFFSAAWWTKLFSDADFWQKWVDRWQDLRHNGQFSSKLLNQRIDSLADQLREAQPRETKKWHIALRGGSYQSEVDMMKNWVSNRVVFIDGQLTDRPVFDHSTGLVDTGASIHLQVPTNATVYYTLDGTDPRLPGGNISPQAIAYTDPIRVDHNVRVTARARNPAKRQTGGPPTSTPWSGAVAATYFTRLPSLTISEIMFNPPAPAADSTNSPSDFEFVEIENTGTETIQLNGVSLGGEITYAFTPQSGVTSLAPGERAVVVKNKAAFQSRYPAVTNIAGEYTGSLSNTGGHLILLGPVQEPIADFSFNDSWEHAADGLGFSLVLVDESTSPDRLGERNNWRPSAQFGGSPGAADPQPTAVESVRINEVLSNGSNGAPDMVELYNASNSEADISGWFLSDDPHNPFKYRIPDNTFLPARSFLVLDEADFNIPNSPGAFGIGASGDDVYLFAASLDGKLLGYSYGFHFGAAEPGVSFGVFTSSDGKEHFVSQDRPSFGMPNNYPEIGPVVISEVLYQPNPNLLYGEFVELENITDAPVALFDPGHPENTWHLRGGVEFDFPPGVTIPPHGLVTVVGFNPGNPFIISQFRSSYGFPVDGPVYGPWNGKLDNGSDKIELLRPLSINATNSEPDPLPHILVDSVEYSSHAPWPAPANPGFSISRVGAAFFGDDPANWMVTWPSPGDRDADGDGLPDRWEIQMGLNPHSAVGDDGFAGDPDNDGFSNWQEFLAGTSPKQADSFLDLGVTRNPVTREVILTFVPVPGRSYTIYCTDDLNSGNWVPLRPFLNNVTSDPVVLKDKPPKSPRFYRLQAP